MGFTDGQETRACSTSSTGVFWSLLPMLFLQWSQNLSLSAILWCASWLLNWVLASMILAFRSPYLWGIHLLYISLRQCFTMSSSTVLVLRRLFHLSDSLQFAMGGSDLKRIFLYGMLPCLGLFYLGLV